MIGRKRPWGTRVYLLLTSRQIGLASCGAATGAIAFPTMLNLLFPKIGYASGVRAGECSA